jgi:hypothetical protein
MLSGVMGSGRERPLKWSQVTTQLPRNRSRLSPHSMSLLVSSSALCRAWMRLEA